MIISKLVIGNFRSYYGEKIFEFKRGLNLILGSNGDGKTTFYDALEFVLGEQNIDSNVYLRSCISAKMLANLAAGEKGEVKVSLEMQNNANQKRYVERSFDVIKGDDGAISISNVQHLGYVKLAIGRKSVPVSSLLQGQTLINLDKEAKIRRQAKIEAEQKTIEEFKAKLVQLPWYIPDVKTMQSMLEKEVCLVCGSKAVKGSDAYNHIASRLQEALEHLAPKKEIIDNSEESKEDTILFIGKSIDYIHQLSIQLYNYGKNISEIKYEIENVKLGNEKIQNHISKKYEQADSIRTKIAQILAQSKSGNDIGGMVGNWSNIKHWFSDKESISVEIDRLTTKIIPQIKESIRQNIEEYKKCAVSSAAKEFLKINNFFRLFSNALENAEERGLEEFMGRLAESANKFLSILNVDDFTGIIRIYRDIRDNAVRVKLIDKSGKIIENPNTSLYTTMHLSVLFAISELTKDNFDNDYPLILDAPTSSFDEGKDKTFYQVMNERLNKQCIVVTKSFLVKDEDTERFIIDEKGLRKLLSVRQIPVYRIEKMIGFDKQDLSSIETIVTPIYY